MKRIYIPLIIAGFCLVSYAGFGQNYLFKVLANKGANEVKSNKEVSWRPVKTGTTLVSGDEIKVTQNSYIGLVHKSGRTIELRDPDLISVDELASGLKVGSTVVSKYADFVLNSLTDDEVTKYNNLVVTGAVTRAGQYYDINVQMPLFVEVLREEAKFKWNPVEGQSGYVVTLRNMFNDILITREVRETEITLDLSQSSLANEKLLVLDVVSIDDDSIRSDEYGIKRLSPGTYQKVTSELEILKPVIGDNTSLNQVMMAIFYEENNLIINALTAYEKAIEMSPDVEDFRVLYDEFLQRNNLK